MLVPRFNERQAVSVTKYTCHCEFVKAERFCVFCGQKSKHMGLQLQLDQKLAQGSPRMCACNFSALQSEARSSLCRCEELEHQFRDEEAGVFRRKSDDCIADFVRKFRFIIGSMQPDAEL